MLDEAAPGSMFERMESVLFPLVEGLDNPAAWANTIWTEVLAPMFTGVTTWTVRVEGVVVTL